MTGIGLRPVPAFARRPTPPSRVPLRAPTRYCRRRPLPPPRHCGKRRRHGEMRESRRTRNRVLRMRAARSTAAPAEIGRAADKETKKKTHAKSRTSVEYLKNLITATNTQKPAMTPMICHAFAPSVPPRPSSGGKYAAKAMTAKLSMAAMPLTIFRKSCTAWS